MSMWQRTEPSSAVLAAALLVDLVFGEPPNAIHPVVWMGRSIATFERFAPRHHPIGELVAGAGIALAVPLLFAGGSVLAISRMQSWTLVAFVAGAMLLKSTFAVRSLGRAGFAVRDALASGNLAVARQALSSLCSREAGDLDESLIVAATVESLAENASDSFVAPVLYYVLFGLQGAVAYRAVNTLDAMIGYHGRYEWLGKASARLDDALNIVPSRVTAVLFLVAAWFRNTDVKSGWAVLLRDGAKTESPNAGRPMAAMAGLLRVRLIKTGHYELGNPIDTLAADKIDDAWRIVRLSVGMAAALALAVLGVRDVHAF